MSVTPPQPPVEEVLAREAEGRPRAGWSSIGSGILGLASAVMTGLALSNIPAYDEKVVTVLDTVRNAVTAGKPLDGRLSQQVVYLGENGTVPIVGAILFGLAGLLLLWPLTYLFHAVKARRPGFPRAVLILVLIGITLFAVGRTVGEIARYLAAADYADGAIRANREAADAIGSGTPILLGQVLWQAGSFALGFGVVMLALNAMRVGLLSRFMGILGMIVGGTFVIPLDQQGVVRAFFLVALGLTILGKWPNGVPPAWSTGKAEPWPTQQQQREARAGAATSAAVDDPSDPRAEAQELRTPTPSPATSKKKRKRRG